MTHEELVAEVAEAINKHESIAAKAVRIVVEACAETARGFGEDAWEAACAIEELGGTSETESG